MRRGCTSLILAATVALWNGSQLMAFDLQGHRGARGLLPENTLSALPVRSKSASPRSRPTSP